MTQEKKETGRINSPSLNETGDLSPRIGLRFYHSRVLDTKLFDGKTHQLYQVTKIAYGKVYYRPVYDLGTPSLPSERLGSVEACLLATFPRIAQDKPLASPTDSGVNSQPLEMIDWAERYPSESSTEIAIRQSTVCTCGNPKNIGSSKCGICGNSAPITLPQETE